MKKLIAIFMLFMYSLSVSGSVVQLHFCGDKFQSVSVNAAKKQKSCCCPVDKTEKKSDNKTDIKKKSCCSQTDINLSIDVDQRNSNNLLQLMDLQIAMPEATLNAVFETAVQEAFYYVNYSANAPPLGLWQNIPLYKLFQSLVYYG